MSFIERDPFARTELHRITVPTELRGPCPECGNPGRFRYFIKTDGGRTITERTPLSGIRKTHPFCSVVCFRTFNL